MVTKISKVYLKSLNKIKKRMVLLKSIIKMVSYFKKETSKKVKWKDYGNTIMKMVN